MQRIASPPARGRRTLTCRTPHRAHDRVVRYRLRMSKESDPPASFAEWLAERIERDFSSDSDFARKANVSPSVVSRMVAGKGTPTPSTLERIAPVLGVPVRELFVMVYPTESRSETGILPQWWLDREKAQHHLARELGRMLADDSPVPADERDRIESLVEAILAPYRRYLDKRRRGAA